jgi:hypothetical protein
MNVKVGDRVLFGKYSGQTVKVDGDELLVMREEDLSPSSRNKQATEILRWQQKTFHSAAKPARAWSRV